MPKGRPTVWLNAAMSLDGKIALGSDVRPPTFRMSREELDHERMRALRQQVDAVVVGSGNVRADNPDLLGPDEGKAQPLRVVMTRSGAGLIPDRLAVFDARADTLVAHPRSLAPAVRERLSSAAECVELGDDEVPALSLLELLWKRGKRIVLLEGGGEINAAFFRAAAVDVLFVTLVPRLLGGAGAPTLFDGPPLPEDRVSDPKLESVERVGDELFLRYRLDWDAQ